MNQYLINIKFINQKINKMKELIIFTMLVVLTFLIGICFLHNKIQILEYENAKFQLMIEDVVNYSDSTADTGEFDEFASPQGKRFFDNYHKLYDK